jgi:hypothetical protein
VNLRECGPSTGAGRQRWEHPPLSFSHTLLPVIEKVMLPRQIKPEAEGLC